MLDVEDWAEIRRLRRSEGMSISQIARVVGLARNTVKAALNSEGRAANNRAASQASPMGGNTSGSELGPVNRRRTLTRPVRVALPGFQRFRSTAHRQHHRFNRLVEGHQVCRLYGAVDAGARDIEAAHQIRDRLPALS